MGRGGIAEVLGSAALRVCRAAREAVYGTPLRERAERGASTLKPELKELARQIDRVAETAAMEEIERLSLAIGYRIELIVDTASGGTHPVGSSTGREVVFAAMDAVDGTIKLGGLGNDLERGRVRAAGDGAWAAALALTLPTAARLGELTLADFTTAAIVDGNPTRHAAYPQEVLTLPSPRGLTTFDVTGVTPEDAAGRGGRRVFTTSNTTLSQSMAYLDSFQAFDRATRAPRDETLAVELYRGLINRHEGGAFDVLRQYANLSALLRVLLGWREEPLASSGEPIGAAAKPQRTGANHVREPLWFEAQGAAFVVVNENLFNLVPAVTAVAGAGGLSVDFEGKSLAERTLGTGRSNVIHAANHEILEAVLAVVGEAKRRAEKAPR